MIKLKFKNLCQLGILFATWPIGCAFFNTLQNAREFSREALILYRKVAPLELRKSAKRRPCTIPKKLKCTIKLIRHNDVINLM